MSYAAALLVFGHGILIDPNLKGQAPDYLDGEKVLIEAAHSDRCRYDLARLLPTQETDLNRAHQQDRYEAV